VTYTAHSQAQGIAVSSRADGTGPVDHIAFNARDYDDVVARLESHGVQAARNDVPGSALRQLFLRDPNGVKIEINVRKV
jgi:catechol 2,3-dioxygenase-like lactoylglutathione lyase family enzyme